MSPSALNFLRSTGTRSVSVALFSSSALRLVTSARNLFTSNFSSVNSEMHEPT
ncbi:hypothetical protein DPMN_022362 [Dreissena polymorpha]|uniref:Uncharacterized protein n=1 Tax=Dreissena polymorpha TaxID=45954 RepID=A0A9D4NK78_DREPO|nr:hypothetical protein DPMN_022362 [Dreissena polymorpha]